MLTYVGKGYTPAFVANLERLIVRLSQGEDVLLVDGPDDICAPMVSACGAHCSLDSVRHRDVAALDSVGRAVGMVLGAGGHFHPTPGMIASMRSAFLEAQPGEAGMRQACGGCEWSPFCTDIASSGFAGAKLKMRRETTADSQHLSV